MRLVKVGAACFSVERPKGDPKGERSESSRMRGIQVNPDSGSPLRSARNDDVFCLCKYHSDMNLFLNCTAL